MTRRLSYLPWPGLAPAFFIVAVLWRVTLPEPVAAQEAPVLVDIGPLVDYPARRPATIETVLNVAGYSGLNDSDELLDDLLETRDTVFELEASVRELQYRPGDEEALIALLKGMDGNVTTARAGLAIALAAPVLADRYTLTLAGETRFAGRFDYDPRDEDTLRLTPLLTFIDLAELRSRVLVSGVGRAELALHRRFALPRFEATSFALSLKHQEIWLYERAIQVKRYRESELFELDGFTERHSRPNLDVSLARRWGKFGVALTLRDLIETTYTGPRGSAYHLRTRALLAVDYRLPVAHLQLHTALSPQPAFGEMRGRRETAISAEFPVSRRFTLSLGYLAIGRDRDDNALTGAISYRLLDSFLLRFSGHIASRRELGGAFELQLPLF